MHDASAAIHVNDHLKRFPSFPTHDSSRIAGQLAVAVTPLRFFAWASLLAM
jgi:hypothetical protein